MKGKPAFTLFFFCVVLSLAFRAQSFRSGTELLRAMHKKFYYGPCKVYTFSQRNTHYKADTISGHSVWHEAIEFPDKFRIDFGDKSKGNYVLFRNDSAYHFKEGKQVKTRVDSNTLLLFLGGMYYRQFEDALARIQEAGYATEVLSTQQWNGSTVFVVGALDSDLSRNQVWVSQSDYSVLRIIEKINNDEIMDMRFEEHQKWCNGFVETKVSFRRNGKLEQVEEYYDIKALDKFPD